MKTKIILSKIKGVFELPIKKYYFGKVRYGNPYFYPRNFCSSIVYIRKLQLKSIDEIHEYISKFPHLVTKPEAKFSNIPMVQRCRNLIVKLFGKYYWIEIGFPIKFSTTELGWKDKFNSPRFEFPPAFQIYFLNGSLVCGGLLQMKILITIGNRYYGIYTIQMKI